MTRRPGGLCIFALVVISPSLVITRALAQPCTADLVIVNAKVHTVDAARPSAEAVAVCGERIARVGTNDEVRRLADAGTRTIDARGRLLVPGFNDAHVHLVSGAEELIGIDLRPAIDEQDFARRLGEYAAGLPKGRWIRGGYWDHEAWPTKTLPTHVLLDRVTPEHPVFVQRLDGHMGVANALAMKLAVIARDTRAPEGGTIVRDASGEPTGVFKDNAMDLITRAIPPDTLDETIGKARAALKHAASLGVTTIQDMTAGAMELRTYNALRASRELTARIYSIQNHGIEGLVDAGIATGFGDDWIRIGGQKLFADGSMGSGTAAFFEPYTDDPSTSGLVLHTPEALETAIFAADAAGFQVIVHAIGDRANAMVLDAFEKLQQERGPRDRRPRIEHAQVVRDSDKLRFRTLGVIASIQPSHCIDDMRWAEKRIGKDRSRIAYNFKSFANAGARIAFGTDWYVEPLNPMLGLYAAVTRQYPDGTPAGGWFPEERITMAQAIEYYTLGSAYAEFAEERKGSITEGKLADMVLLSKDLFSISPREILETKPVLTIVGGRVVYGS
ncbi:MAG: amidohydrolase [Acidobacteria bacterium]|nr:MAG: amidohydrolase [Acidobacteriota bacterium]